MHSMSSASKAFLFISVEEKCSVILQAGIVKNGEGSIFNNISEYVVLNLLDI